MINKQFTVFIFFAVSVLPLTNVFATESSANAAITSNYVFRGQTQTDDGAAVQASYDIQKSEDKGWYAGAWGSNVDNGLEVDLFGGWRGEYRFSRKLNLGYDVGAILYKYTDNVNKDITEIYAGVSYESAYVKLYSGSGSGVDSYSYLDLGASFIVLGDLDLDLHFGRYLSSPSSSDISANLSTEVKGYDLSLGLTYEDAGVKNDLEFFVTVGKSFDL